MNVQLHIGIDDTDSTKGGCTTYIAARLAEKISKMGIPFIDYPNIIRLNPNIPYKTRGNAAVALRINAPNKEYDAIQETVIGEIEKNSQIGHAHTEPAAVFIKGPPPRKIKKFSERALSDVLTHREALKVVKESHGEAAAYGGQLGLVGAVAAVGQRLRGDHTFELIAYRTRRNLGSPRLLDENSVIRMDNSTRPRTFNNYDYKNKRILITPHGPDPVLLGIRGETHGVIVRAFRMLTINEPVERWVIFRTNHGTEAHFKSPSTNLRLHTPVIINGIVGNKPTWKTGGHVIFTITSNGGNVDCAAYEPTGSFREDVAQLIPGDAITVFGAFREPSDRLPPTINLEKLRVDHLIDNIRLENPICPRCAKHMKSAGKHQGFRCERCGMLAPKAEKKLVRTQRTLRRGVYLPSSKAHRHLTKPLPRYGREKKSWDGSPPTGEWHDP